MDKSILLLAAAVLTPGDMQALEQAADTVTTAEQAVASAVTPDEQAAARVAWDQAVSLFRQRANDIAHRYLNQVLPPLPGRDVLLRQLKQDFLDDLNEVLEFGPVAVDVDFSAIQTRFPTDKSPAALGLLPPTGLGVRLSGGVVEGGGRIDYKRTPREMLQGLLGLNLQVVQVNALGILEKAEGDIASLVLVLSARFTPGIQLGFGFALSGVGGLIGVNRRLDIDMLRAQFSSGAVANALFADDPIKNAESVLNTLGSIFIPRASTHVFGPTIQITWLKISGADFWRADIGIFAELPHFSHIVLLGSARAEIPPLLHLRLDILGDIDFPRQTLTFAAALVNSHILGVFRVAGTAAFQAGIGDKPFIILTIGGFYPGFNPEPASLPPQQRVSLTFDNPLPGLYFRAEGYFAVTPNTLQFGGLLELGFGTDDFGAHGFIQLDAFLQFTPLHFETTFAAGFEIEAGIKLGGVTVSGSISGPGPILINAHLSFEIFLLEVSWSDTFTFGSPVAQPLPNIDLLELFKKELIEPANLHALSATDRWVTPSNAQPPSGMILVSPLGQLVWSQRRSPLNLPLERFDGIPLPELKTIKVSTDDQIGLVQERFAPGQYRQMSESEQLNQPPFDLLDNGLKIAFGSTDSDQAPRTREFEEYYRPPREDDGALSGIILNISSILLNSMHGRLVAAEITNLDPKIGVVNEAWAVHGRTGADKTFNNQTAAQVHARINKGVALPALDVKPIGDL